MRTSFHFVAAGLFGLVASDAIYADNALNKKERDVIEQKLQNPSSAKTQPVILEQFNLLSYAMGPYKRMVTGIRPHGECMTYSVIDGNPVSRLAWEFHDGRGYALLHGLIGQKTLCRSDIKGISF